MKESRRIHAAAAGNSAVVKELLAQGVPVDIKDENGATPLFVAAFHGRVDTVRFLLGSGANVNAGNVVNYTPLMAAAREKRPEVVAELLGTGADPELMAQGMKAIHWALMNTVPKTEGHPFETETRLIEILKIFKKFGASLNTKGERGNTALMDAAWWGLALVVEYLLRNGGNASDKNNGGETAADYANKKLAKNFQGDTNERCHRIIQILSGRVQKP